MTKIIIGCSIAIVALISICVIENYHVTSLSKAPESMFVRRQKKETPERQTTETWEAFNTTNPHNDWCPDAVCHNNPICTPCNRRFLLLITTGRSGSTTLLSMINKLPGVRLSGENWNEIEFEKRAVDNLYRGYLRPELNKVGAWAHNKIPDGALSCATQKMFEMINPPTTSEMNSKSFDDSQTILGFKTIRFQESENIEESIQFLKDSFPCARIILNIRSDIDGQVASHKKTINNDLTVEEISREIQIENAHITSIAKKLGDERARLIDMSKWTKGEEGLMVLNDVVHWLGFRNCKFSSLFHENDNGFDHADTSQSILSSGCHYGR